MSKADIIIIRGASCTGKSTLANLIRTNGKGVCIEIDSIRFMINGIDWFNSLDYENAIDITLKLSFNFLERGYSPIYILDTLPDIKLNYVISHINKNLSTIIYSLFIDECELLNRLIKRKGTKLTEMDIRVSQKQNQDIMNKQFSASSSHHFIDTTNLQPIDLLKKICTDE